jgi:hypothetical protein
MTAVRSLRVSPSSSGAASRYAGCARNARAPPASAQCASSTRSASASTRRASVSSLPALQVPGAQTTSIGPALVTVHRVNVTAPPKAHGLSACIVHGFASILLAWGEPILYVSQQLGHSSAAFTLTTYAHLIQQGRKLDKEQTLQKLSATARGKRAPRTSLSHLLIAQSSKPVFFAEHLLPKQRGAGSSPVSRSRSSSPWRSSLELLRRAL